MQPEFVQQAMLRLSTPGARVLATCNPKGPRAWFKTDIINRITEGQIPGRVTQWSLYDNTFLDKGYIEDARSAALLATCGSVTSTANGHRPRAPFTRRPASRTGDPPPMRHYAAGIDYGSRGMPRACVVFGQAANGTWARLR